MILDIEISEKWDFEDIYGITRVFYVFKVTREDKNGIRIHYQTHKEPEIKKTNEIKDRNKVKEIYRKVKKYNLKGDKYDRAASLDKLERDYIEKQEQEYEKEEKIKRLKNDPEHQEFLSRKWKELKDKTSVTNKALNWYKFSKNKMIFYKK